MVVVSLTQFVCLCFRESDEKQDEGSQYTALYRVRGIALGRTTLQFVAVQKEHVQVYSQAREIQVGKGE